MNPLESRKQLLIAESELNRSQLVGDMETLTAGVRALTDRARSFGVIASSVALLAAGYATLKRGESVDSTVKPSLWRTIRKGVGLISTVWLAFRSRRREWPPESMLSSSATRIRPSIRSGFNSSASASAPEKAAAAEQ
jgi:hypothetical protein